jgi:predicted porin
LQVAAPSADANIDGIRQYVQPVNYTAAIAANGALAPAATGFAFGTPADASQQDGFDYDQDITGKAEKITYLSPNFAGFQFGASYTHDLGDTGSVDPVANGFNAQDDSLYDEAYEVAARYEGVFNGLGFAAGAGYTRAEEGTAADEYDAFNVGLDVDAGPFGIGAVYLDEEATDDVKTYVVGADYTTGPFKFGASYYNQDDETVAGDLETDRYTGGVIYTAGPGLSFRGSISHIDHDLAADDFDATSVMGGVQINF